MFLTIVINLVYNKCSWTRGQYPTSPPKNNYGDELVSTVI